MSGRIQRLPRFFRLSIVLPLLVLILAAESPGEASAKPPRTDRFGDPLPPGAIARLGTIRLRPGGLVSHLAFSPDGKRLASWSNNHQFRGRLSIWDTATGRELRSVELSGYYSGVMMFVWLADGRGLAVLNAGDGAPYVWDFTDEKSPLPPIGRRTGPIAMEKKADHDDVEYDNCFTIAPNGKLLAVGRAGTLDRERPIFLREPASGKRAKELKTLRQLGQQPSSCESLVFTADGRSLLVFSGSHQEDKNTLVVWDVANGKKIRQITVPSGGNRAVSPDGKMLAFGLPDDTVHLWDLTTGREQRSLMAVPAKTPRRSSGPPKVAFSTDGKHLITAGRDNVVRLWETAGGREVRAMSGHRTWIESLAVSSDGKRIASGDSGGQIRIWDAATGTDVCPVADNHTFGLWRIAVSADGTRAVSSSRDGTVRLWDVATGRQTRRIDMENWRTLAFAFTRDGKAIVGSSGERMCLWDAATGAALPLPAALKDHPCLLPCFSPDGKTLLTMAFNDVSIWEWPAGRLTHRLKLRANEDNPDMTICNGLALSPDGRRLVTLCYRAHGGPPIGDERAAVDLWDVASGKRLRRLRSAATEGFRDVAFTPDGAGLLLADGRSIPFGITWDGITDAKLLADALSLLDVRTGKMRRAFPASDQVEQSQSRFVHAIACSPDGRAVAGVEHDGSILLFEIATGLRRRRLTGHRGEVMSLVFTPDGKRLVTASSDSTGLVWDVSLAALADPLAAAPAKLWDDLASPKVEPANRALATLAAAPDVAVPLLKEHLRPADGPDTATLNRLLADLDSDSFAVRQKAAAELDRLGEDIVFSLRKRLGKGESLEARRRIQQLLDKHDGGELRPERVRELRALEILEQIATPEARRVLVGLSKGAAEARLTQEAKACLTRMDGIPKSEP
jgi:WD40 repeat protein